MKLFFLWIFFVSSIIQTPDYVIEYHDVSTKEQEIQFINKYQSSKVISVQAYVVSLQMKQAKHKFFPWKKLEVFNTGKKKLEALIQEHPENTDLRYVRLLIQENIPSILNYKSNIAEDKAFLNKKLEQADASDYLDYYIKKNTSL